MSRHGTTKVWACYVALAVTMVAACDGPSQTSAPASSSSVEKPAAAPLIPNPIADCSTLAKVLDPVNVPGLWFRFESYEQREAAWCKKKRAGTARLLTSLKQAEGKLSIASNREWTKTAREYVEHRIKLIDELCASFEKPYEKPTPNPREYELLRELQSHNGKIGYVSSTLARMKAGCPVDVKE